MERKRYERDMNHVIVTSIPENAFRDLNPRNLNPFLLISH